MAGRLAEDARAVLDPAAFGIGRAEVEPADARKRDGRRAHGAGLQRDVEVASVSRSDCSAAQAARIASISACAVGSLSSRVRLPARASTLPSAPTTTAPTGTSPRAPAASASARAASIWPCGWRRCHKGGSSNESYLPCAKKHRAVNAQRPRQGRAQARRAAAGRPMRIAKALARAGLCSRRDAERWIEQGRVSVNGKVLASPALDVSPSDRIVVDGNPLPAPEPPRLWRYHKPKGLVTTHADPQGRPTVFDALPEHLPRVVSIGRLDFNTRRAAAAHQRRRARPPPGAARHRLDAALSRACARQRSRRRRSTS